DLASLGSARSIFGKGQAVMSRAALPVRRSMIEPSSSRSKRSSCALRAAAKVGSSVSFGGSQLPISWRRSPLRYASRNSSGRRPLAASQFSLPSTVPGRSAEGESGGGSHLATRNGASDIMTRRPATTLDVIYSLSNGDRPHRQED